ncbi:hypothetical protein DENIS_0982 [Desulfonema ishimotonii]|uniref:Chemotaxis phosphatase CheX-like domain-containing protein n=2 Tax=Desulfonema ishimotonii TaxID=45657 RepID=A0A401FSW8_9BACT|nr:hypothetical protein DENIS_0982 [Desulfonema ishimotonii]
MKHPIEKVLYSVADEVLGKLAFIFSFPEHERAPMNTADAVAASVSFKGPFDGNLTMFISGAVLPELTGNMLGVDDASTTEAQQFDALRELINVICGNLLPRIAGKRSVFNVSSPRIISRKPGSPESYDEESLISMARLTLEEGECDLCLFVRGRLPDGAIVIREAENSNGQ